jgi:hypothetical protein
MDVISQERLFSIEVTSSPADRLLAKTWKKNPSAESAPLRAIKRGTEFKEIRKGAAEKLRGQGKRADSEFEIAGSRFEGEGINGRRVSKARR